RFAAMVAAVFVVTRRCAAAAVVGAFSVVSHNYLRFTSSISLRKTQRAILLHMDINAIREAAERIRPYVKRTPLEYSHSLSQRLETNVYVKYELFQRTGSFKPRGAFNKILSLTPEERARGVVAVSSGNHAQGVAYA